MKRERCGHALYQSGCHLCEDELPVGDPRAGGVKSPSDFTVSSPRWDDATKGYPRVPGVCVLMRTKHYRDGHKITEPVGVAPDPEVAAAWIASAVRSWSTDVSVIPEECPTYYFVPVPNGVP